MYQLIQVIRNKFMTISGPWGATAAADVEI